MMLDYRSFVLFIITLLHVSVQPVYSALCQITNCAQCNGNTVCDSCDDGFFMAFDACLQCPSHCLQCLHSHYCTSCVSSFWNPGGQCNRLCSTNCSSSGCDDANGVCYDCMPGIYGPRCDQDCTLCRNGTCNLRQCTNGCRDGYVQLGAGYGYLDCYPCPTNCIKCSNTTYCTQCGEGYYGQYYRIETGRGTRWCKPCHEDCTKCTSIDLCPVCNTECIKQGCDVSGSCVTIRVTTSSTLHTACPNECMEDCDVRGKCLDTTTRYSKSDGSSGIGTASSYYEGLGHGMAGGIGIVLLVGTLVGIVVFFARRTNCFHTMSRTKSPTDSRQQHVYVNTQEHGSKQPASSDKPEYEDVEANSEVRVTMSEQQVDGTDTEYISLGERQPEHNYIDLHTNMHDGQ